MSNIRETDAIQHIFRCFDDDNIIHVDGNVNPIGDKEIIDIERSYIIYEVVVDTHFLV